MTFWRVCSRTEGVQQVGGGGCAVGLEGVQSVWRVCSQSGGCAGSQEGVQSVPVCRVPMQ